MNPNPYGASDLVWSSAHGAPALEDDPVAAMLGLVPDPHFQLDYVALARICKANHVKPTALAERLVARGWELKVADVFRWQTRSSPDVSPALIRAIAQEIRCGPEQLTLQAASQPTPPDPAGPHYTAPRDTRHTTADHDRQEVGTLSPDCTACQELITAYTGHSLSQINAAIQLSEAFRAQYLQPNGDLVIRPTRYRSKTQQALADYEETRPA